MKLASGYRGGERRAVPARSLQAEAAQGARSRGSSQHGWEGGTFWRSSLQAGSGEWEQPWGVSQRVHGALYSCHFMVTERGSRGRP